MPLESCSTGFLPACSSPKFEERWANPKTFSHDVLGSGNRDLAPFRQGSSSSISSSHLAAPRCLFSRLACRLANTRQTLEEQEQKKPEEEEKEEQNRQPPLSITQGPQNREP
ncbi:hypothetical protein TgHK011_004693 [Trichoderma gracile]|nr:hypothetical protein TgHK011_004693 [Trichoderma gracile]